MIGRAMSIGPVAARTLRASKKLQCVAVFRHSIHLQCDDSIVCLVAPHLGNGPLNIIAPDTFLSVIDRSAQPDVRGDCLLWPQGVTLCWRDALQWMPCDMGGKAGASVPRWRQIRNEGLLRAPDDSFFHISLGNNHGRSLATRVAMQGIAALDCWVRHPSGTPPIAPLIGLGSGLTPAGDDFIGGLILAARHFLPCGIFRSLRESLLATAPQRTTLFSRSLLLAACDGFGHEDIHALIDYLADENTDFSLSMLDRIDAIGHSSGWDTVGGILLASAKIDAISDNPALRYMDQAVA